MNKRLRVFFWNGWLVFLHFFLVVALLKSNFLYLVDSKFDIGFFQESEISKYIKTRKSFLSRQVKTSLQGSVLFIGDSRFEGLGVSALSRSAVNLGVGGDTTKTVLMRLDDYKPFSQWPLVCLQIGFNDLKYRTNEEIIANYIRILKSIKTDVLLFSVIKSDGREAFEGYNKRIHLLNIELEKLSEKHESVYYFDSNKVLIDELGNLSQKFHLGDGVHLNKMGQEQLISELKERYAAFFQNRNAINF